MKVTWLPVEMFKLNGLDSALDARAEGNLEGTWLEVVYPYHEQIAAQRGYFRPLERQCAQFKLKAESAGFVLLSYPSCQAVLHDKRTKLGIEGSMFEIVAEIDPQSVNNIERSAGGLGEAVAVHEAVHHYDSRSCRHRNHLTGFFDLRGWPAESVYVTQGREADLLTVVYGLGSRNAWPVVPKDELRQFCRGAARAGFSVIRTGYDGTAWESDDAAELGVNAGCWSGYGSTARLTLTARVTKDNERTAGGLGEERNPVGKLLGEAHEDLFSRIKDGQIQGSVNLSRRGLTELPDLSRVKVTGHFDCSNNSLTSLVGAPHAVGGGFNCSANQLTSLKGAPHEVGGIFVCWGNPLPSNAAKALAALPAVSNGSKGSGGVFSGDKFKQQDVDAAAELARQKNSRSAGGLGEAANRGQQRRAMLFRRDGPLCHWCGRELQLHPGGPLPQATVEHLRPVLIGGTNRRDNLRLACEPCNKGRPLIFHDADFVPAWEPTYEVHVYNAPHDLNRRPRQTRLKESGAWRYVQLDPRRFDLGHGAPPATEARLRISLTGAALFVFYPTPKRRWFPGITPQDVAAFTTAARAVGFKFKPQDVEARSANSRETVFVVKLNPNDVDRSAGGLGEAVAALVHG